MTFKQTEFADPKIDKALMQNRTRVIDDDEDEFQN